MNASQSGRASIIQRGLVPRLLGKTLAHLAQWLENFDTDPPPIDKFTGYYVEAARDLHTLYGSAGAPHELNKELANLAGWLESFHSNRALFTVHYPGEKAKRNYAAAAQDLFIVYGIGAAMGVTSGGENARELERDAALLVKHRDEELDREQPDETNPPRHDQGWVRWGRELADARAVIRYLEARLLEEMMK